MNRINNGKIVQIVTKEIKTWYTQYKGKSRNYEAKHGVIITLHFTDMRLILENILSSFVHYVVTSRVKRVLRT